MNNLLKFLGIIALSALTSYVVGQNTGGSAAKTETAFERVMRTNTLRCGYYVYPPVTYRDANTGKLSGFAVDMMERIAAKADLKIEWAEEVSFGNWPAALEAGRFDLACTPMWPTVAVGRVALIGKPLFFSDIHAIGRVGETRFASLADLDKPEVKISIHDGNDTYYLVKEALPHATLLTLPANADGTAPIMDVVSGKADVMISDLNAVEQWNVRNDKKVAVTAGGATLKRQPFTLAVKAGENSLNDFLNNAVDDLLATNTMATLLDKWMEYKGVYRLPAEGK